MELCRLVLFISTWPILGIEPPTASGQTRDTSKTVVDVVHVKNQKAVRGLILGENAVDGIAIAVSKKWLESQDPETYAATVLSSENEAIKARLQLRDRLRKIVEDKTGALGFYVRKELERMDLEIENALREEYQFLIVRVKSTATSSRSLANEANRRIALWSWFERLAEVENRKPSILASELKSKNIDTSSTPPSLADRFYPVTESEEQWVTRLAIVSHRLDHPVEFQGTGDVMFAVGGEQLPDVASLMGQMMQSQWSALLQELASGTSKSSQLQLQREDMTWIQNGISQAERMDAVYFRATRVSLDPQSGMATVESRFMVKQPGANWSCTWRSLSTQSASDQTQDSLERIKKDPQIRLLQTQFQSTAGNSGPFDNAIRVGAATMVAQRFVNDEFLRFSDSYLRRLNSPPILPLGK